MDGEQSEIRAMMREVIEEYVNTVQPKPEQQAELDEGRIKREELDRRLNELSAENQNIRRRADEADRNATVRAELQKAGVAKLELAYKAIKDEIQRSDDGRYVGPGGVELKVAVAQFVNENPELLPARLSGGSGMANGPRLAQGEARIELEKIRPGMSPEELERVRQEIARVASQTLRGW